MMKKLSHGTRHVDGITIVEALVAICLLGFCIAGGVRLIVSSREMSDRARSHYMAINIAKNRIERARTIGVNSLDLMAEDRVVVNQHGVPEINGFYRRTTSVTNLSATLWEIHVTVDVLDRVKWEFTGERESLQTYIASFIVN